MKKAAPLSLPPMAGISRRARYIEQTNPLRSLTPALTIARLEEILWGRLSQPMWLFHIMEQSYPELLAVIERRKAALLAMDYDVRDDNGSVESIKRLKAAYARIRNMREGIAHLALATFRGFSICQWQDDAGHPAPFGMATQIRPIPHWHFVRDGMTGGFKFNPDGLATSYESLETPELDPAVDHVVIRTVERPIDRIALIAYTRSNYSLKSWAEAIELYARNGTFVTMPQSSGDAVKDKEYLALAQAATEAGCGAMPYGSTITSLNALRGALPFRDFQGWLREQVIMAGTGGLLTMLQGPGGIGQGSSGEHGDAFQTLAASEAGEISECFQRHGDELLLGDEAARIWFEIAAQESSDPGTILDHAGKAKAAGMAIDPEQVAEKTGYRIAAAPAVPPTVPPAAPVAPSARIENAAAPARREPPTLRADDPAVGQFLAAARMRSAAAAQTDLRPVAERVAEFLRALDREDLSDADLAASLTRFRDEELPKLAPKNPELATALHESWGVAFLDGLATPAGAQA